MTKYSVKKPFTVLVGVVLVLVLGVVSFLGLNTDLLPAMDLPYVVVYTVYPGASPERVELAVTQPLEQAVATTSGLENVSSISSENLSLIIMEFNGKTNMDSAMIELSNSIDMVKGYLDDMVQSPTLMKINPDMLPVQMLSVDAQGMDIKQLSEYVESDLAPRLERIDGVATVDISGAVHDHIEIRLNQEKIDKINDQILKSVNNELYKAKKDLDKTKQELEDQKNNLSNLKSTLAKSSADLDQLMVITSETEKINADIELYKTQQQLLAQLNHMVNDTGSPDDPTLPFLNGSLAFAQNSLQQLQRLQRQLAAVDLADTAFKDIIAKAAANPADAELTVLAGTLQYMIGASLLSEDATANSTVASVQTTIAGLEEGIRQMQAGIETIKKTLADMGVDRTVIANMDSTAITPKLEAANRALKQAEFLKKQLESIVGDAKKAYADLEAGKIEIAAGSALLESGLQQLDSGIKQFEDARDSALKQANIDALVTQEALSGILMAQNFSMPSGYISDGDNRFTVKVGDVFTSLEELENLLLLDMDTKGVDPIHLKDVADIEIKDNAKDSYVRVNGNPSISLSIQKSSTASTSRVSDSVNREVREIMAENADVHITQLMDQGIFIELVVNSVISNMVYGGIIALFVLVFFLKDIKPTLIIGFAIPLSVLFAIVLMYFSNVNLNVMSLSGIALAVGMLVDNSIVVIENIYRLRNLGYPKVKAAVIGAQQVAGAIAASTLTTICVFLPIVFTDGLSRQLFTDMGLTIGYSLVASLIVALTVVPTMASNMLNKTKDAGEGIFGKITGVYKKALEFNLDHKWIVLLLSVGLLIFSGWQATKMPMGLIPTMESTQMSMTLSADPSVPDEEIIAQSEEIVRRTLEIEDVVTVGSSLSSSDESKSMSFNIVLSEDKKLSNAEIADLIEQTNPEYAENLSITESTMDLGALAGSGISIQIKGNDLDTLQAEAVRMAEMLKTVEGVDTVKDGSQDAKEEVRIDVNKAAAMKHGLTVAQVFQKVNTALTENTTATTVTFNGTDMDAIIYASSTYNLDTIGDLVVATETDDNGKETDITLSDIATIGSAFTPDSINRSNLSRYVTVSASMAEGYNATLVAREVEKQLENWEMPKGYSFEMTGEDEAVNSAMFDMVKMIALAIVFIYLIMVAQFQSLKSPFIVMFTIPLAFTGGLLALLITGEMLSIVAMIGFLVLAGVVVNNGIVFVDYVNTLRMEGMDKRSALVQTGTDRIRPILMTALTTILANSTMAMGVGMGAELSQGMAMVSIGGLSYATLLTLFLVPVLYDIFNRGEMKVINVDFKDEE